MDTALYCVRTEVTLTCRCCSGRQAGTGDPGQTEHPSALWRPWMITARDTEKQRQSSFGSVPGGFGSNSETRQPLGFQHPVRLYLPRSKAEHYLHHMGEKVLASFPVQATIHFYNDDSDTEEEEEELRCSGLEPENAPETTEMFWKQ
ncbi:protein ripply3 [Heterodontus francisci]|uniref:protein ripply3 n=1 Tax=Heterodontus francisci TaxID=7792 RepID=UPI00355B8E59